MHASLCIYIYDTDTSQILTSQLDVLQQSAVAAARLLKLIFSANKLLGEGVTVPLCSLGTVNDDLLLHVFAAQRCLCFLKLRL